MATSFNPYADFYNNNPRGMDRIYREKLEQEMYYKEQQIRRELELKYMPPPSAPTAKAKDPKLNKNLLLCN